MTDVPITRRSTTELRSLVRRRAAGDGTLALDELVARNVRGVSRLLREVALDESASQPLRLHAVAALGRSTASASLDGLRAALEVADGAVEQRAIERLGKVGAADDLDLLRRVRSGDRTTQRVLRTAKAFLSYRHRLGAYRLDAPTQRIAAEIDRGTPIRTTTPTKAMLDRLELVAPPVPGIALEAIPLRRVTCVRDEFAVVLNAAFRGQAATTLSDVQGIPAVLLRFNPELGAYTPAYYLLADPSGHGRLRLLGVRGSGRVGLAGAGEIVDERLRFELNATEAPLEHPLTVTGSYDFDTGALRFDVAVVESRFSDRQQRLRRRPRPVTRPA